MEKKERVLAYKLATTLQYDEFNQVSGGSYATKSSTFGPSGSNLRDIDANFDFSADW